MRSALTLIEVLVAVCIIALLVALLLPTLRMVRDSSRTLKCSANLRQIMAGIHGYGEDWKGKMVPLMSGPGRWFANLAPYLDAKRTTQDWATQGDLMKFNSVFWGCPVYNVDLAKKGAADYDWRPGYGLATKPCLPDAVWETNWSMGYNPAITRDIPLASLTYPSQRIISGDTHDWHLEGAWSGSTPIWPSDGTFSRNDPKRHRGKANYGFVDGHVATLGPVGTALGYLDPEKFGQ